MATCFWCQGSKVSPVREGRQCPVCRGKGTVPPMNEPPPSHGTPWRHQRDFSLGSIVGKV
jgi:DnaJ-class molecular chaperone